MKTFEITIQRKQNDVWPVVAEHNETGTFLPVQVESTFQLDLVALRAGVNPKQQGTVLGQALFRDGLRDAFVQARVENTQEELHVFLVVEDRELRGLRWGQLCAPLDGEWRLLALDQRVPYSLYLPSLSDRRFPPIGRDDLRALIVAASPDSLDTYGMTRFEVGPTVADARSALGSIPSDVLATVDGAVGLPTLDALCGRLTAERYTLLHVICHGALSQATPGRAPEPILYLANASGGVDAVTASRLVDRLKNLRGAQGLPHLTFLSNCFSASESTEATWDGLGQQLVREIGMPAVIGMTDAITIETANALTRAFYAQIWEHGKVDSALVEACAALAGRRDVTVPILLSRLGGRPLFSLAMDKTLSPGDIEYGLARLKALAEERAPTLREQVAVCADTLASTLGKADALGTAALETRRAALTTANVLGQEIAELTFNDLALKKEPPTYDNRCPFRGLYPFRPEDRTFFFGRERLVEALVTRLGAHPFLPVLGPSGSGKSSLVLAGLVPALQQREPGLKLVYLTPGADPPAALTASVQAIGDAPSVIVVDQLEEMFTLCHDLKLQRAFAAQLLEVAARWRVILTMRADFWDECAGLGDFTRAMQTHQELIGPLDGTELRAAIDLQAKAVGLSFEAGLSDTILSDVQEEPGAMPLLQHALFVLWNRRRGRWLRVSEYADMGGVQGAIATSADTLYEALAPADKARAEAIFMRLTRLDDEALPSERPRDTRRRVPIANLVGEGGDATATRALIRRLADARLLVTGGGQLSSSDEVQVAHEALIRHWPRLREWLNQNREFLLWRQRLGANRDDWEQNHRDDGDLLRGLALGTAERWLKDRRSDLNTGEVGYITASTAAAKRRRITSVAALAAAFLAISAFAIFAGIQWRNASRSADDANIARGQALEGYEMAKEAQGEAERQTSIAVTARDEAQQQRAEAQRQTGIAVAARDEAEKQARLAEDQRKVALGRQLAADSELIRRQRAGLLELSTLLAVESLQHFRTLGGDLALRGALDLLPRPVATVDFGGPPLKISPDGRLVLTSVGSAQPPPAPTATTPEYQIRDAQTGRLISRLDAARSPSDPFFSQDGRLLFADMHSTTPHVWDTATGARVAGLPELADQRIVLSPDGRFMAATTSPWADLNATVFRTSVYDTTTWNRIAQLRHAHSVNTLTFSPDGKYLATANGVYIDEGHAESDVVRLWELARCQDGCQELAQLEHGGAVNRIAFAADGQRFATASSDRNIRIWERKPDGSVLQLRKQEYQRAVSNALLSADGRYFAGRTFVIGGQKGGDYSEPLSIYDVQDSQQVAYIVSDSPLIYADFAPDSPRLLTFSADGLTRLWEAEGGREVTRVGPQHEGPLPILSPDGTRLVTGDKEGHISTWEPRGGHERMWARHDQFAVAVAFSGDGKSLVSGSYDGTARVWDLATGKEVACIDHRGGACTNASEVAGGDDSGQVIAVAISPDSQLLATGSRGQNGRSYTARVRPLAGGSETVLPHTDNVNAVAFSPDGKRLATGSRDHQVRIWDIATGTEVLRLPHEGNVTAVAFHPDGRLLATAGGTALGGGTGDNTVRVWDLTTRQEVTPKVPAQSFWSVAFSPDGTSLAAASNDGMVRFWAVPGFQKLDLELRHESSVNTVVFSPDGKFVATAHANAASVWDLASGQEVSQVAYAAQGEAGRRLAGPVRTVAFGHDGRTLATAGEDGVRVWIAPTDDLITEACARLTRNLREPEWRTYLRDEVPRKTCPSLP